MPEQIVKVTLALENQLTGDLARAEKALRAFGGRAAKAVGDVGTAARETLRQLDEVERRTAQLAKGVARSTAVRVKPLPVVPQAPQVATGTPQASQVVTQVSKQAEVAAQKLRGALVRAEREAAEVARAEVVKTDELRLTNRLKALAAERPAERAAAQEIFNQRRAVIARLATLRAQAARDGAATEEIAAARVQRIQLQGAAQLRAAHQRLAADLATIERSEAAALAATERAAQVAAKAQTARALADERAARDAAKALAMAEKTAAVEEKRRATNVQRVQATIQAPAIATGAAIAPAAAANLGAVKAQEQALVAALAREAAAAEALEQKRQAAALKTEQVRAQAELRAANAAKAASIKEAEVQLAARKAAIEKVLALEIQAAQAREKQAVLVEERIAQLRIKAAEQVAAAERKFNAQAASLATERTSGLRTLGRGIAQVAGGFLAANLAVFAARAAIQTLSSAITESVAAAQEQEDAIAGLNGALASTGQLSQQNAERLIAQAGALQKVTTFGDEAIIPMEALLLTMGRTVDQTEKLAPVVLDLAEGLNIDLASAAKNANKVIGGMAGELGESLGPAFVAALKQAKTFDERVALLAANVGGRAAQAAQTFSGRLQQLKNVLGDIKEGQGSFITNSKVVSAVLEVATDRAFELSDAVNAAGKDTTVFDAILLRTIKVLANVGDVAIRVGRQFQALGNILILGAESIVVAFTGVAVGIGHLASQILRGLESVIRGIKTLVANAGLVAGVFAQLPGPTSAALKTVASGAAAVSGALDKAAGAVGNVRGGLNGLLNVGHQVIDGVANDAAKRSLKIREQLTKAFDPDETPLTNFVNDVEAKLAAGIKVNRERVKRDMVNPIADGAKEAAKKAEEAAQRIKEAFSQAMEESGKQVEDVRAALRGLENDARGLTIEHLQFQLEGVELDESAKRATLDARATLLRQLAAQDQAQAEAAAQDQLREVQRREADRAKFIEGLREKAARQAEPNDPEVLAARQALGQLQADDAAFAQATAANRLKVQENLASKVQLIQEKLQRSLDDDAKKFAEIELGRLQRRVDAERAAAEAIAASRQGLIDLQVAGADLEAATTKAGVDATLVLRRGLVQATLDLELERINKQARAEQERIQQEEKDEATAAARIQANRLQAALAVRDARIKMAQDVVALEQKAAEQRKRLEEQQADQVKKTAGEFRAMFDRLGKDIHNFRDALSAVGDTLKQKVIDRVLDFLAQATLGGGQTGGFLGTILGLFGGSAPTAAAPNVFGGQANPFLAIPSLLQGIAPRAAQAAAAIPQGVSTAEAAQAPSARLARAATAATAAQPTLASQTTAQHKVQVQGRIEVVSPDGSARRMDPDTVALIARRVVAEDLRDQVSRGSGPVGAELRELRRAARR